MARKKRRAGKKAGRRASKKKRAPKAKRSNVIPLPILQKRLVKLHRIVKSRGGKAAA